MDCSIRISAGLCSLTTRRSFSQLTTSFFGSQCQGIRPALLLALPFVRFEFSLIHCSFFTRLIFLNRVVSLDCISSYFSYSIFKFPFSILFQEQKLTDNSLSINFHSWLVGTSGLEPPTSRLSGVRSNQLSYKPIFEIFRFQWRWRDSNSRPPACKAGALPTELRPRCNLAATYFPIPLPV